MSDYLNDSKLSTFFYPGLICLSVISLIFMLFQSTLPWLEHEKAANYFLRHFYVCTKVRRKGTLSRLSTKLTHFVTQKNAEHSSCHVNERESQVLFPFTAIITIKLYLIWAVYGSRTLRTHWHVRLCERKEKDVHLLSIRQAKDFPLPAPSAGLDPPNGICTFHSFSRFIWSWSQLLLSVFPFSLSFLLMTIYLWVIYSFSKEWIFTWPGCTFYQPSIHT